MTSGIWNNGGKQLKNLWSEALGSIKKSLSVFCWKVGSRACCKMKKKKIHQLQSCRMMSSKLGRSSGLDNMLAIKCLAGASNRKALYTLATRHLWFLSDLWFFKWRVFLVTLCTCIQGNTSLGIISNYFQVLKSISEIWLFIILVHLLTLHSLRPKCLIHSHVLVCWGLQEKDNLGYHISSGKQNTKISRNSPLVLNLVLWVSYWFYLKTFNFWRSFNWHFTQQAC